MKEQIKKYWVEILLASIGSLSGIGYWYFIGCATGTCAITSNWYTSAIYGTIMGFLIGQIITDYKKKKETKEQKE